MENKNPCCNKWAKVFLVAGIVLLIAGLILLATSIGFSHKGKTEKLVIAQSNMAAARVVVGGVFMGFGLLISCLSVLKSGSGTCNKE